jgi:hypothetical protein
MGAVVHEKETPDSLNKRSVVPRRARQETEIWREKENLGGTNSTNNSVWMHMSHAESKRNSRIDNTLFLISLVLSVTFVVVLY